MSRCLSTIALSPGLETEFADLLNKSFPGHKPVYHVQKSPTKYENCLHHIKINVYGAGDEFFLYEFLGNSSNAFMVLGHIQGTLLYNDNFFKKILNFTEELGKYLCYSALLISLSNERAKKRAEYYGFTVCVNNIFNSRAEGTNNYILIKKL